MSGFEEVALISMIVGGAVAADGAAKQGQAQYQASQYQAGIAQRNAQISQANSAQAIAEGKIAEQDNRDTAASLRGTQRAVQAGLGQLLDTGSASQIVADTGAAQETDAQRIRYEASKRALGFQLQGQDFTSQGQLDVMQGNSALSAGNTAAFATILGTAGKVGSMQYEYNKYKTSFKGIQ